MNYNTYPQIIIIGLPGSGKDYLAKMIEKETNYNILPHTTKLERRFTSIILISCHFCKEKIFDRINFFFPNALYIFFDNDWFNCHCNLKFSTNCVTSRFLLGLSKQYNPKVLANKVKYAMMEKVYKSEFEEDEDDVLY